MTLNQLLPAALLIIVAVIGVSVGAQVLGQIQGSQDPNSAEYNITGKGLEALGQFGDWFGVIVIVVIAVIVIGLVLMLSVIRQG